jgi:hypothetical protein
VIRKGQQLHAIESASFSYRGGVRTHQYIILDRNKDARMEGIGEDVGVALQVEARAVLARPGGAPNTTIEQLRSADLVKFTVFK